MVDLIIGGASKAGTTALYDMLKQRDEFFLPEKKELHYFSWPELSNTTGGPGDKHVVAEIPSTLEKYLSHFQGKRIGQVAVDISPSYLFHHASAERIQQALPDVRLCFILRKPVDKVYSQYVHLVGEGREIHSFEEALTLESDRKDHGYSDMWLYRESGFYAEAIDHFQRVFGRDRVMVVLFEDFVQDPKKVLRELCCHVGLDGTQAFDTDLKSNVSGLPKSALVARLISPNLFTRFLRQVLPTSLGGLVRRFIRTLNSGSKPVLPAHVQEALSDVYRNDIVRLESLIGRSTGW